MAGIALGAGPEGRDDAVAEAATALELDDVQGLIVRGYRAFPAACFVLLRVADPALARAWIRSVLPSVLPASRRPEAFALHLAWTYRGLRALGLDVVPATFSREFREGMGTPERARALGDVGDSAPDRWLWGGPHNAPVHLAALLYARDDVTLESRYAALAERYAASGLSEVRRLDTRALPGGREHFGFRDGIGQPIVAGFGRRGAPDNTLPAGEFVLGYPNAYERLPRSPSVAASVAPPGDGPTPLADTRIEGGARALDLGRNGSYLVFRQLRQDVPGFWRFLDARSRRADGASDPAARVRLGAKMVGRWPSGAPLTVSRHRDDGGASSGDDFGYHANDREGFGCPLGSHIRRANPRDALEGTARESIRVANRHRLLRRGRAFGAPIDGGVDGALAASDERELRGLHFLCFNTDIGRQFEFVQQTWINNNKFAGLHSDGDPLIGRHHDDGTFTIPEFPVRRRLSGMRRFVELCGGEYFFVPGLNALRFMAASC